VDTTAGSGTALDSVTFGLTQHQRVQVDQMLQAMREAENSPSVWTQVEDLLLARQQMTGAPDTPADLHQALAEVQATGMGVRAFLRRTPGGGGDAADRALASLAGLSGLTTGTLFDRGWTPAAYRALAVLSEHAVAHGLPLASDLGNVDLLRLRLVETADGAAIVSPVRAEVILGWLTITVAARDAARAWEMLDVVADPADPLTDLPGSPSLADWAQALGAASGLAWAAGLGLEEATAIHAAGTPLTDRWRGLAALRGFTLPAADEVIRDGVPPYSVSL
jgi:hypothetical protein